MKRVLLVVAFICLSWVVSSKPQSVSLAGEWMFRADPMEVGLTQKWFKHSFGEKVVLPGSMNVNGMGDRVTSKTPWTGSMWNKDWYDKPEYAKYRDDNDTKIVFWLQPDKYYAGMAWYQKYVDIPKGWNGKDMLVDLERCHWVTSLWVDDSFVGTQNSLSVPHRYLLKDLNAGRHLITIRVDNKVREIQPGVDAHSVSDNTQTNWNGIIGNMTIEPVSELKIDNVKISARHDSDSIELLIRLKSELVNDAKYKLSISGSNTETKKVSGVALKGENKVKIGLKREENSALWDEFTPALHKIRIDLEGMGGSDSREYSYGIRSIDAKDSQIVVNGRAVFFRGTLDCSIFPLTGYPPTTQTEWEKVLLKNKEFGLNHIRFHSWCPPRAAFEAADKLGMFLQVECAAWATVGDNAPIDEFIEKESVRIVEEYGNHPSFCLLAYGNEPSGDKHKEFLYQFVDNWNERDDRFLVTTGAGWPAYEKSDFHCLPAARIQQWGAGVKSVINKNIPSTKWDWTSKISKTVPTISHEIGQWCVYPLLSERAKYTGVLKAKNYDIFEDRLRENSLLHLADSLFLSSGKLQMLCYKADIEAGLRTPNYAGFQLLGLQDFSGQGTATVGVVDSFWEDKAYVSAQEFTRFCSSIVPLFRTDRFVYNSSEKLVGAVEVAQYSSKDLRRAKVKWTLTSSADGELYFADSMVVDKIETGNLSKLTQVAIELNSDKPAKFVFTVWVGNDANSWDIWVYPKADVVASNDVRVCSELSQESIDFLLNGGKLLLSPKMGTMINEGKDSVVVGFSSVFWNTLWTNLQPPHTLGVLCDPKHPALELFPTEYHSNYQWQAIVSQCNAIPMHKLGSDIRPIVRIIDTWFTARSFGLIVEAQVGKGRILICSSDLLSGQDKRIESHQLFNSMVNYMNSSKFNPEGSCSIEQVKSLLK